MITTLKNKSKEDLLSLAYTLSFITIFYNIIEGGIFTYFGSEDETLAFLGLE